MSGKYALIIGNTEYTDPGLAQLTAPGKDAEDFAEVLKAPDFGGFDDVQIIFNPDNGPARVVIDKFFNQKKWSDLLIFYFSGHGVRDDDGLLHLAVKNTQRSEIDSTGIESAFIRKKMEKSLSKRQVLILDCCNSGAFAQGTKGDDSMGTQTAFIKSDGSGQIILAASDKIQHAFDGDKVIGDSQNSVFTKYLIKGLRGEADHDSDGQITVAELYYYVSDHVKAETKSRQTPTMFANRQEGEIFLRQGLPTKPLPIGQDILVSAHSEDEEFRLLAVKKLNKLMQGKDSEKALSAQKLLEQLAKDISRQVADAAWEALHPSRVSQDGNFVGGSIQISGSVGSSIHIPNIYYNSPNLNKFTETAFFEPETILIPAGPFWMGSDPEAGIPIHETPRHELILPNYRIGKYPITKAQYGQFVHETHFLVTPEMGWDGQNPPAGAEQLPVVGVTWFAAITYCEWLSRTTGRKYFLPNEAQWEKACCGSNKSIYPWGDIFDPARCNHGRSTLAPVDAYPKQNDYGCFDLVGNVRQWTCTLWGEKRIAPDPKYAYPWQDDGRNDLGANRQVRRVVRGSSFRDDIKLLGCSVRSGQMPDDVGPPGAHYGFRVVMSA